MEITLENLYLFFSNPFVLGTLAVIALLLTFIALYLRFFVLTADQRNLHSYACRYPDDKDKVSFAILTYFLFEFLLHKIIKQNTHTSQNVV